MGYKENVVPGEVPDFGAIFMSNIGTKKECFKRKLFGLPSAMTNFVRLVKKGMILFLFEFERRQLFGVFRATSDGGLNIEPNAFKSSGKHFPAQVRFTQIWNCDPLDEHGFRDAIIDNYFSGKKFNFGLSEDQVRKLMMMFIAKRIPKKHPERCFQREGDKPFKKDRRFGDDRNLTNDRIGFSRNEDGHRFDISSEFVGDEVKEVDDNAYLNGNFVEKDNKYNYDLGQGTRTVTAERSWKNNEARFVKDYATKSDNLGDRGTRQAILGDHLDPSLGGFRGVADATPCFMGDIDDEHVTHNNLKVRGVTHNNLEVRGVADKDKFFMMEKIKNECNIEDDYGQVFSEPHEKRFCKIGVANSDRRFLMDSIANKSEHSIDYQCDPELFVEGATFDSRYCVSNRLQDEYPVGNGSRASVSAPHLGSPCNGGSRTINDGRLFGNDIVGSEQRTLTEPLPSKLRGAPDVVKPDYDENFSFGPVAPTTNSFGHGVGEDCRAVDDCRFRKRGMVEIGPEVETYIGRDTAFSHSKQSTLYSSGHLDFEAEDSYLSEQLRHSSEFDEAYNSGIPCSRSHDTMITRPIPYDPEIPHIELRPSSCFGAGPGSSPVGNSSFYQMSKENLTSFPMSESLRYHLQNEGSTRYLADAPCYSLLSKSDHTVSCREMRDTGPVPGYLEENKEFQTAARDSLRGPLFPEPDTLYPTGVETAGNSSKGRKLNAFSSSMKSDFAYDSWPHAGPRKNYMHKVGEKSLTFKEFSSSDSSSRPHKEDPICDIKFSRAPESNHLNGTNKRVSVFARLSSAPEAGGHEPEIVIDEQHDLDSSVNKVMKMLEKVVSSPVKKTGKEDNSKHTITASEIIEYELSKVKAEPDTNLAYKEIESGSILQETRLIDFKRRKKVNKSVDGNCQETSAGVAVSERPTENMTSEGLASKVSDGDHLMGKSCNKRRKLVRPTFVRNESTAEGVLKDDSESTKAVDSCDNVDASMDSVKPPSSYDNNGTAAEPSSVAAGNGNADNNEVPTELVKGNDEIDQPQERVVVDAMIRVPPSKDNQTLCGWIEW